MKKIISLLALSIIIQSFAGLNFKNVYAANSSGPVIYSFDNDYEGWELGESKASPTLTYENENGNGYLRLRAAEGTVYSLTDGINVIPNGFVELKDAFKLEKNSETVISADVRTSDMSLFSRGLMLNRDLLDESVKNEIQYNLAVLWGWNRNNEVSTYEKNTSRNAGPYKRAKGTVFSEGVLENDKWYTIKSIIYTNENGFPEYLETVILDENTVVGDSGKLMIENDALKLSDSVTRLDIALMQSTLTVPEGGASVDFDNVKIYKVSNERTWSVADKSENNIFANIESINIAFSGAMDSTSITDENITLISQDGQEVEYSGVYNPLTYVYTLTPVDKFKSGKYLIKVNKAAINGIDDDGNVIEGLSDEAEESIGFTVFLGSLPEVKNIKITGKLKEDTVLRASAEYYQAEGIGGSCKIRWECSDSENGEFSVIEGQVNDSLIVSKEYINMFIRFSAIPITDDGIKGDRVFSEALRPLKAPIAEIVKISGPEYEGMQLMLSYDYRDENGDKEDKSIYEWFASDDKSVWNKIEKAESTELTLDSNLIGKYIKASVTPVAVNEPYTGVTVESNLLGPIKGIDDMNLISNPGFETGNSKGWGFRNAGGDQATVTATQEEAFEGEWAGKLEGQTENSTFMVYRVNSEKGIKYIANAMMKVAPDSAIENGMITYYGEGNPSGTEKVMYPNSNVTITKEDWKAVTAVITAGGSYFSLCPQFWANGSKGFTAYIDNFYIAPLLVSDIITTVPQSMNIPENGENTAFLSLGTVRNQLGGTEGLENETAFWEIDDNVKGVFIEDNVLHVTSSAVSGTVNVKAVCIPGFSGAFQEKYVKNIPIELISNNNKSPKIISAVLSGDTAQGSVIALDYEFYQVDGNADSSIVKWYVSDSENGTYTEIQNVFSHNFTVTEEYADKYIRAEIEPIDSVGNKGAVFISNVAGPKKAPEARNVSISGKGYVGDVLKGSYEYCDFNNDSEGETIIKWLKSDKADGVFKEICGANGLEYTVTENDANSWFKMSVTPVSVGEPYNGAEVLSNALQGPFAPIAKEVTIERSGKILVGKYTYESPNGVEEGETVCEWFINGSLSGKGTSYTIDFTGSKTVEFKVTPRAISVPYNGISVSCVRSFTGGNEGNSSGGGGGGQKVSTTILPPVPQKTDTKSDVLVNDILGHWSESYAKEAIEKGIMNVDSANNFNPDRNVTRAEMITYIFKALNYDETEYRDEFEDVKKENFYAKMLQTMVDKGIISKDTNFRPNDYVSRQEVCKILSISLNFKDTECDLNIYKDIYRIDDWAVRYVKNIVTSKLMTGVSDTEFSPRTNITNAQIAKIISMIISGQYIVE